MTKNPPRTSVSSSDAFELWQLADELANSAERIVCDAFTASTHGIGRPPSDIQLDVAHALRKTSKLKLKAALEGLERP
ncbi:hypothetical protein [Caenimonas soli]|uniref:hypothetical protein n=1 Tax=Caenimonas soli TaxID=2735555 RepID=UPI001552E89B|nr:hypothetical protein [Caenimonas soli]NPC58701.1 hypothetical protein [Caenimonas soli]